MSVNAVSGTSTGQNQSVSNTTQKENAPKSQPLPQDTVEISSAARAKQSSGDVDHDGDSK